MFHIILGLAVAGGLLIAVALLAGDYEHGPS